MPEQTFVGRQSYLERFEQLLNSPPGQPYIMNLRGEGGLGKTKILQQFFDICAEKQLPNSGIIDFYNYRLNSQISALEYTIADRFGEQLGTGPFDRYWQSRREAENNLQDWALREASKRQFMEDLSAWIDDLAEKGQKAVFLFDTIEAIQFNQVGSRLINSWLPLLRSGVVVLCGRQQPGDIEFPAEIQEFVIDSPLGVFDEAEAIEYLTSRGVWDAILESGVNESLFELTERRPILLALSTDWILQQVSFGHISPVDLVSDTMRKNFESKLVQYMTHVDLIPHPEHEILPYMAHIPRSFDAELLRFMLPSLSETEAHRILKNLSDLSFIKATQEGGRFFYWFQDELRSLFHEHVFLAAYPFDWDQFRRDASQKMLEYYDMRIAQAEQEKDFRARQRQIANRLYHEVYLERPRLRDIIQQARDVRDVETVSNYIRTFRQLREDLLDDEESYALRLFEARWLNDIGNAQLARQRVQELLQEFGQDEDKLPFIHNVLGRSAEELGKLDEALGHYQTARELREKLGLDESVYLEELNLSRVHDVMGDGDRAIEHVSRARDIVLLSDAGPAVRANVLSRLGFLYALYKQYYDLGYELCTQAIGIWQELDQVRRIAQARINRSRVLNFAGEHQEALQDIEQALQVFSRDAYPADLVSAHFSLGITQLLIAAEQENNLELLAEADNALNTALSIASEYNQQKIIHQILTEKAYIYWLQHDTAEARNIVEQAYPLSIENNDAYYQANCLVALAEFDYDEGDYQHIESYAKDFTTDLESKGYHFPLFSGRMRLLVGHVAFTNQEFDRAFLEYYADAFLLLAQHGGYSIYRLDDLRNELVERLQQLSLAKALDYCDKIKRYWSEQGGERQTIINLIEWVNNVIWSLKS